MQICVCTYVCGTFAIYLSLMSLRMENYLKWQIYRWNVYMGKCVENVEQSCVLTDYRAKENESECCDYRVLSWTGSCVCVVCVISLSSLFYKPKNINEEQKSLGLTVKCLISSSLSRDDRRQFWGQWRSGGDEKGLTHSFLILHPWYLKFRSSLIVQEAGLCWICHRLSVKVIPLLECLISLLFSVWFS